MNTQKKEFNPKSFKDFTNLYSLNKTLRFSLTPNKKTAEILEFNKQKEVKCFSNDRKIAGAYQEIKKYLNKLHQEFIQEAMKFFAFSEEELKGFEKEYLNLLNFTDKDNFKKKNKIRNEYEQERKILTIKIATYFSKFKSEKYQSFNLANITGKKVFSILEQKYKEDKKTLKIIHIFKYKPTKDEKKEGEAVNFSTYLTGFNENRKNFYKSEDKAGQFATRTIDNLAQFIKNKKLFEDKYQKNYSKIGILDEQIKIFNLDYFNNLFLQEGLDEYNGILGNNKGEENKSNEGINQKINIFKQKEKARLKKEKENFNKSDFPLFKELYKQIGSIRKENDVYVEIKTDKELVEELNNFPKNVENYLKDIQSFYKTFFEKLQNEEYELDKIYLPKSVGTYFSYIAFSDWNKLAFIYNKRYKNEKIKIVEGGDVNVQYRSLEVLKNRIDELKDEDNLNFNKFFIDKLKFNEAKKENNWQNFWFCIEYYINSQFIGGEKNILNKEKNEYEILPFGSLKELKEKYFEAVKKYKEKMVDTESGLTDDEEKEIKETLKNYLDRIKEIERIAKYFDLKKSFEEIKQEDLDSNFYGEYQKVVDKTNELKIYQYYSEFRNYLTQNNSVEEKIKLNFNSGLLLDGWDLNKEKVKFSIIFQENGKYYLGIINKEKDKTILDKDKHPEIFTKNSDFRKMEYKLFPSPSKMLPKISFSETAKKGDEDVGWSEEIQKIKDEFAEFQEYKKKSKDNWKDEFNRGKLNKLIDYYKQVLEKHSEGYMNTYNFELKDSSKYKNLGEFNDDIARQNYKVKFVGIDKNYIDEKVANGELFLFQIYNKDFSEDKKEGSTNNLETIYFKELFSKENLENPVFKLSGGAEMFFRNKIEKKKEKKKLDKDGKPMISKKGEKVVDKRRFSENKILFHLPIEINYGKGKMPNFNKKINEYISKNPENIKIIGIDRGEKHLLYYSIIDQNGNNIESMSLNAVDEFGNFVNPEKLEEYEIDNNGKKERRWKYIVNDKEIKVTNYQRKLDELEKERQKSRQSWQNINKIKNLKKGYISFVVKKIVDLAIENNAIIILEDLNFGFKSFRQKIEKNVYQQFEKALIDKLGFVVDKQKQNQRFAPQLSAPFESFQKIGKQTGIVYYVLANNTSKVCPSCQWIKNFYLKYEKKNTIFNLQKNQKLKVFFEQEKNRFRFEYQMSKEYISVYSDVDRQRYDKTKNQNKGGYLEYKNSNQKEIIDKDGVIQKQSITLQLKELFKENHIDLEKEILKQLDNKKEKNSGYTGVYNKFIYLFNLILQIRNAISFREKDYIQCPSCHFDTRKENYLKINDGDGNGAYNIALRGLYLLKGKNGIINNLEKIKLIFSNNDYFQWAKKLKNKK